jgi:hypothetical protein
MNVHDIIKQYLIQNGRDGLVNCDIPCGCGIDDLIPCCEGISDCVPAYKVKCDGCFLEDSCEYVNGYYHAGSPDECDIREEAEPL